MALREFGQVVWTGTVIDVRYPREHHDLSVIDQRLRASIDDIKIDHMSKGNRLLADDVVQGNRVIALQIPAASRGEARPFPQDNPGLVAIDPAGREPVKKTSHDLIRSTVFSLTTKDVPRSLFISGIRDSRIQLKASASS